MIFELVTFIALILAIVIVFKIHDHLTRTIKILIIIGLFFLAYVAFMNMVSYKTFDLTTPKGILKATTYHMDAIFSWAIGLWPEGETKTTGRVVEDSEEEEGRGKETIKEK